MPVVAALTLALLMAGVQVHAEPAPAATDIHTAVRTGDAAAVRRALMAGADVNKPDNWGRTPLIVALQQAKTDTAELLINQGAGISLTDAWGRTPLLVATQLKNTAAIQLLLTRGADVNVANKNDITPLIAAAQTGNHEAMSLLLGAGATLDRTDNLGWTALMWAANRNDGRAVKMLVDKGADVSRIGRDGSTALELARNRAADTALPAGRSPGPRQDKTAADTSGPPRATAPLAPSRMPVVNPGRIVRGRPDAVIAIVEYTDFQCPYCGFGAKTVEEVLARYEGQARLVVKHLPLQFHPMAKPAAQYFEALSLQSAARAWAFYDRLFENQRALAGGTSFLRQLAGDLGANVEQLEKDLTSPVVNDRLASDLREAERYQFDGVPAFIINGQVIEGAQPVNVFVDVIEAILRR